jgi:DNA-binding CsgD family transcriptional regulator/PAS domain-containing protein
MAKRSGVDPELVSLIGAIYDCVIEPQRWHETIDGIRLHLNMHNGLLGVVAYSTDTTIVQVACGVPPEYQEMFATFTEDGLDVWGGLERMSRVPLEEPVVQSRLTEDHAERWARNKYMQKFAVPQGLVDSVAMVIARDRTMYAGVEFSLHKSRGPVEEHELEKLRILAPHFRRAVTISRLLEDALMRARTFAAALEASPAGIVLVDETLAIIHANARAHAMLAAGDPVRERNGRLSCRHEIVPGRLAAAVASASRDEDNARAGLGIPSRWLDETPAVLHVLPLEQREIRPGVTQRAVAAVFIAEATSPLRLPGDALALLYSLTPAETRVFEHIADGLSLAEIAREMGSTTNTVRTHLQRIFDKTGCHRQAELVGLARTVTLPA